MAGQDAKRTLLINTLGTHSPVVEAFRTLRTNIQFAGVKSPLQIMLVTSVTPGDGKSSVSANLAAVMAMAGTTTLLVDADLRKPVQNKIFGVKRQVGLTNVLLGSLQLEEVVAETSVQGLKLLPSGPIPPNPSELLGSGAMQEILKKLKTMADLVIVDTPPLMPVTDAAILAPNTDGVLLVVRAGKTQRQATVQAKQLLMHTQARLLGVVVNDVKPEQEEGYYHYYAEEGKKA